jgi:hypothetical protein
MRTLQERRISRRAYLSRRDRDYTVVRNGNEVAHGGDILGDIAVMCRLNWVHMQFFADYEEDFKAVYGIHFVEACRKLSPSHPKIVRIFNIVASIRELFMWRTSSRAEARRDIDCIATLIINIVRELDDIDEVERRLEASGELGDVFAWIERRYSLA